MSIKLKLRIFLEEHIVEESIGKYNYGDNTFYSENAYEPICLDDMELSVKDDTITAFSDDNGMTYKFTMIPDKFVLKCFGLSSDDLNNEDDTQSEDEENQIEYDELSSSDEEY